MVGVVFMQRHTKDAEMIVADDFAYPDAPHLVQVYQLCQHFTIGIVLLLIHLSARFAHGHTRLAALSFAVDLLTFEVIYYVFYQWMLATLFLEGHSIGSQPLSWNAQMIYRTRADDEMYDDGVS